MAFSLFGLAAAAGAAAAQSDPRPSYAQSVNNVKISPWPSAAPAGTGWSNAAIPPTPLPSPPSRTLYYKKEPNNWVVPAAAQVPTAPPVILPVPTTPTVGTRVAEQFRLESEATLNSRINREKIFEDTLTDRIKKLTAAQPGVKIDEAKLREELRKELPDQKLEALAAAQAEEDRRRMEYNKTIADARLHKNVVGTYFPELDPITKEPYQPRMLPQGAMLVEPHYVCYGRLFFEEKNTERYGWDFGPLTPIGLTFKFFGDAAAMPYKVASFPRLCYDSSAGQCLPGDSVPFKAYPQPLSLTGALAQAGVIVALAFIFP